MNDVLNDHGHSWTRRRFLASVAAGGAVVSLGWPRKLSWASEGAAAEPIRLAFYTDIHARTEWETPVAMMRAVSAINAQKPDLVLAGGDLITDGFQSSAATVTPRWDAYLEMHHAIKVPVQPVIGNHDLVAAIPEDGTEPAADPRAIFREKLGLDQTYRSWDAAGIHFVALDAIDVTGDTLKYRGYVGSDQLQWLKDDLAGVESEQPIILITHMPLMTAFFQGTKGITEPPSPNKVITNNLDVLQLFAGHNLVLVLQGHLHVNEMLRWRNTTFITGGAVSGRWWRGEWHGTKEGFGVVTLRGHRVEWEYIEYGWEVRRPPNA